MIEFKKLKWKNFLSTGNQWTELDLTESLTSLIVGENGAGKSTFLDALTFSLFGKPYRRINKPQLINSQNNSDCLTEIEFEIGTNEYKIIRGLNPHIFEIYINDELLDQDGRVKEYQTILEKKILKINFKSFTQIIILGSSTFQPFMQLNPAQRREVIEDLLDIQIFSRMNEILKFNISNVKSNLDKVTGSIKFNQEKKEMVEGYIQTTKDINNNKIDKLKKGIMQSLSIIELNEEKKKNMEKALSSVEKDIQTYDIIEDHISDLKKYQMQIESKIKKLSDKIDFYNNSDTCHTCNQDINKEHKDIVVYDLVKSLDDTENGKEKLLDALDQKKVKLEKRVKILDKRILIEHEIEGTKTDIIFHTKLNDKLDEEILDLVKIKEKSPGDDDRMRTLIVEEKQLSTERKELVDQRQYNGIAYDLLKDTGIKTSIIKQYLPVMNNLINKYLQSFDCYFNFTLDENFDEVIKSNYRDEFSYESFSEGEKMRIDLALLFTWRAVSKMKNSANTNLLILDEIFDSSLDDNGTEEFMKILTSLDNDTNVFVISHKGDILADKFERLIKFEKVNNFSKMV
jgi:DNA repair exonuclease SbcCD ATPase subunit